jgi:uncharacterized protein YgiM (DUF1202 family)
LFWFKDMFNKVKLIIRKSVSIFKALRSSHTAGRLFGAILLTLLLASCAAAQVDSIVSPGAPPSDTASAPGPGPSPTLIETTPPDSAPSSEPAPPPEKSTGPSSAVPAGLIKNSGQIVGSDVAFRKGADPDSAIISRLSKGTFVEILKTNVNAQWHQVKYNDKTGYVNRMYICLILPSTATSSNIPAG